jgi:hypothetical protein
VRNPNNNDAGDETKQLADGTGAINVGVRFGSPQPTISAFGFGEMNINARRKRRHHRARHTNRWATIRGARNGETTKTANREQALPIHA